MKVIKFTLNKPKDKLEGVYIESYSVSIGSLGYLSLQKVCEDVVFFPLVPYTYMDTKKAFPEYRFKEIESKFNFGDSLIDIKHNIKIPSVDVIGVNQDGRIFYKYGGHIIHEAFAELDNSKVGFTC